jgi:transmembrane sensor
MMSPESPNTPTPRPACGEPVESASGRTVFDWPAYAGATDEVLRGLDRRARVRRQQRVVFGGAIAAALILGMGWLRPPGAADVQRPTEAAVPTVVEHRVPRQVLPDGSVVDVREGAEITVDFSESFRRVTLQKGAVHFAVAKDPARPFIVKAGDVEVRAVGTEFVVDFAPASVEVLVTEGRVAVETTAEHAPTPLLLADLSAGRRVSVLPDGAGAKPVVEELSAQDLSDRLSWRVPLLRFAGTPLADVAAQFNRYNPVPLVLAHDDLAGVRLSGSLRADRLEALISILESDFGLRVEREAARIRVYRAR